MVRMTEENVYANVPKRTGQNKGLKPLRGPQRRSKVTVERVALVVLSVLLLAAVAALIGVSITFRYSCENKPGLKEKATVTEGVWTTNPTTASSVTSCPFKIHCDTDWELNGPKCYYFSTNGLSWNQSEAKCTSMGGRLVKINSREEQRFLYGRVRNLMRHDEDKFWIGLTDSETEGEWKWTDGSALNTSSAFWFVQNNKPEPDNWTGHKNEYPEGEDCVRMGEKRNGFEEKCWFDKHCNSQERYICQKKTTKSPDCQ